VGGDDQAGPQDNAGREVKRRALANSLAALLALGFASAVHAEDLAGDWIGRMASGFTVRMHVDKTGDGYDATLTNPSGSVTKLEAVASDGSVLAFRVADLELAYSGVWNETQQAWTGTLRFQGEHALAFKRATAADLAPASRRRPQEGAIAAGPLPYAEHQVAFDSTAPGVRLAGALTVPQGAGPFPAVVLISGTGPNDRGEDVDGHKVLRVVADALTRAGFAVLRYDKRGVGGSTGVYPTATTADFAADAAGALRFLKGDRRIDAARIGLLGHSEGGFIAPMVAADDASVAFVILVAAPGVRGDRLFVSQAAATAKLYGVPEDYIARRKAFDEALYAAILAAPSEAAAQARVTTLAEAGVAQKIVDPAEARALPAGKAGRWARAFLAHDPAPVLARLKMPVLALGGSLDAQVPADENLAAIGAALKANDKASVRKLDDLNHLLQTARTGAPNEYAEIEETVAPSALQVIAAWAGQQITR
jgi:pimeloyl-ACP methyl ester carboxylesterase